MGKRFSTRPEDYEIFTVVGTVAGSAVWSETRVGSTTTGGYNGQPAVTQVSSSTTQKNRFFLVMDDGEERKFDYSGSFGVRDGHKVMVVYGRAVGEHTGYYFAFYNQNTREQRYTTEFLPNARGHEFRAAGWWMLLLGPILGVWMFGWILGLLLGFGAPITYFILRSKTLKAIDNHLFALADRAVQQAGK